MDQIFDGWSIEFHSGVPAYKQIVHQVQAAIALGELQEGEQLPTLRELHLKLKVNPNTVAKAYRELEVAGLIATTRGSGCFVAPTPAPQALSPNDKHMKLRELAARFMGEAKSYGIPFDELVHYLSTYHESYA